MPTPVEMSSPLMATFNALVATAAVVAPTASPRYAAVSVRVTAIADTLVLLRASDATFATFDAAVAILRAEPTDLIEMPNCDKAAIDTKICELKLRYGSALPMVFCKTSETSPNLLFNNCSFAFPVFAIVSKASFIVPVLPAMASTFSWNLSASFPVKGVRARSDSALPKSLP